MKLKHLKIFIMLIVFLLVFSMFSNNKAIKMVGRDIKNNETSSNATLTIVYDNYEYDNRLKTGFGFSCLVKTKNKSILFDTGSDSETLLGNMEKLGINPKDIGIIVLSHIQWDHVGGLKGFLEKNSDVEVYVPKSFPSDFKNEIKSYGASVIDVYDTIKIFDGIYSTGELGVPIKEQSLIIKTEKGLIVITGCAHPGIVNIVKESKRLTKEDIYLVIGGFHLGGKSDYEIRDILESFRKLGVKKVAPCHCTGDGAINLFKEEYKEDFIKVGVGKEIRV
jgi:7,8-dihydropterin-6-yl-methyl-4-(beta-D-ribofuranosyl)aminobenzene 5'-phosphate synthase